MTILKKNIIVVDSLPKTINKKISPKKNKITLIITLLILTISFIITYKVLSPYINAVNINNIIGKKVYLTDCNTKDFIIITKNKTFSMQLTNENCEKIFYDGNIKIKNNEIIFYSKTTSNNTKQNIKGIININNNIIINNNEFKSETNE